MVYHTTVQNYFFGSSILRCHCRGSRLCRFPPQLLNQNAQQLVILLMEGVHSGAAVGVTNKRKLPLDFVPRTYPCAVQQAATTINRVYTMPHTLTEFRR